MENYERLKVLGRGSFGTALLVRHKSRQHKDVHRVVKEIDMTFMSPDARNEAQNEAEVLRSLSHVNIVRLIDAFPEKEKLCIVMEYADGGDLAALVRQRKDIGAFFEEAEVMATFVQCCMALQHAHSRRILHRDIKCQNIFLTKAGTVKVGDFGIAKVLDHTTSHAGTRVGTPVYAAPEVVDNRPYGLKADIWSMGVVLFEMLALEPPFSARNLVTLVLRILTSEPKMLPPAVSDEANQLVARLLRKKDECRPSIDELMVTPIIARAAASLATQRPVRPLDVTHASRHTPRPSSTSPSSGEEDGRMPEFARARTFTAALPTLPGSEFNLSAEEVEEVELELREEMKEEAAAEAVLTQRMESDPKDTLEQLVGMLSIASEFQCLDEASAQIGTVKDVRDCSLSGASSSRSGRQQTELTSSHIHGSFGETERSPKTSPMSRSTSLGAIGMIATEHPLVPCPGSTARPVAFAGTRGGLWKRHVKGSSDRCPESAVPPAEGVSKSSSRRASSACGSATSAAAVLQLQQLEPNQKFAEKQAFALATQWSLNAPLRSGTLPDAIALKKLPSFPPASLPMEEPSSPKGGSILPPSVKCPLRRGAHSLVRLQKNLPPHTPPLRPKKSCASTVARRPRFLDEVGHASSCLVTTAVAAAI